MNTTADPHASCTDARPVPASGAVRRIGTGWLATAIPVAIAATIAATIGALLTSIGFAHPTGTMIAAGDRLLWSYVCPVESADHRACVMVWDEEDGVRVWLTSQYASSDWMLARTDGEEVLLVERYYDPSSERHRARILEGVPLDAPRVLHDWFIDTHRFGEAGFLRRHDGDFLFARYPHLYAWRPGSDPVMWDGWTGEGDRSVAEVELVPPDRLLIRAERDAWLTSLDGEPVAHWPDLLDEPARPLPFMGDRVFDAAVDGTDLLLAYWGGRRFDTFVDGRRSIIHAVDAPFLPHAVAAVDGRAFLLASSLDPGIPIRPRLWVWEGEDVELIWEGR